MTRKQFQKIIYDYYREYGRYDMAWRKNITPYKIVVSEIMLQQTQVTRVTEKFREFIKLFPSFSALAKAETKDVLRVWQGLGYNRRALALKKLAEEVAQKYNGKLPAAINELVALPGIGPATAAAISVYAFNAPAVFIETNIRTIFIHFFFADRTDVNDKEILPLVEKMMDRENPREWYWALMDYGVMLKKEYKNPSRKSAHHVCQSKFEGSRRQVRGKILKLLLEKNMSSRSLAEKIKIDENIIKEVLLELEQEKFIRHKSALYFI